MPGGQGDRWVGIEKFRREPAVKLNIGTGRRLEELAKVTAEILGGVGVVGRFAKRFAKRLGAICTLELARRRLCQYPFVPEIQLQ